MSRQKRKEDIKMYNRSLKMEFIKENFDEPSQLAVQYFFNKTMELKEKGLNKDIYDFTEDEIEDLFYALEFSSIDMFNVYKHYLIQYLNWAEKNNLSNLGYNIISVNLKFKNGSKFLDKIAMNNKYLTKNQVNEIIYSICNNDQDSAMILSAFEGIHGTKLYEIRSLQEKNIDKENNTIKLFDKDKSERTLKTTPETIKLILEANEQIKYNNYARESGLIFSRKLVSTEYVFKIGAYRGNDMISYNALYQRLKRIAEEEYGNGYVNFNSLRWSGIFHYFKIWKNEGNFKEEYPESVLKRLGEKYNIQPQTIKNKLIKVLEK